MTHISKKHLGKVVTTMQLFMPTGLTVNSITEDNELTDKEINYNPIVEFITLAPQHATIADIIAFLINTTNEDIANGGNNTGNWDIRPITTGDIFMAQLSGLNLEDGVDVSAIKTLEVMPVCFIVKSVAETGEVELIEIDEHLVESSFTSKSESYGHFAKVYVPMLERYGYTHYNQYMSYYAGNSPSYLIDVLIDNSFVKVNADEAFICPRTIIDMD